MLLDWLIVGYVNQPQVSMLTSDQENNIYPGTGFDGPITVNSSSDITVFCQKSIGWTG